MKYSSTGFRPFHYQFVLFPIVAAGNAIRNFRHFNDADSILTFGYIDHETGFRFEILSTVTQRNGDLQIHNDRPKGERAFIMAETVSDIDGIIYENGNEIYGSNKELIDSILEEYRYSDDVMKSRMMTFLDGSRDLFNVDDVQVHLLKKGNQPEICWVRIEGLTEHSLIGELLNEPVQDFGYHMGEKIGFHVQETVEKEVICISDMNPSASLTKEDLKDGSMLKETIRRFNSERNEEHFLDVLELLRDSDVVVPCTAVLSDADQAAVEQMIKEAEDDLSSLAGKEMTNTEQIRMVPDILQNGDDFFFPVFSSAEEMGEYGDHFSQIECGFLQAMSLAKLSDKKVKGIVVNAFSEQFVLDAELFDLVEKMKTRMVDESD